jgi:hypothetical protein
LPLTTKPITPVIRLSTRTIALNGYEALLNNSQLFASLPSLSFNHTQNLGSGHHNGVLIGSGVVLQIRTSAPAVVVKRRLKKVSGSTESGHHDGSVNVAVATAGLQEPSGAQDEDDAIEVWTRPGEIKCPGHY